MKKNSPLIVTDLIVNIFQPEIRRFYDLESFWSNGDNLTFP